MRDAHGLPLFENAVIALSSKGGKYLAVVYMNGNQYEAKKCWTADEAARQGVALALRMGAKLLDRHYNESWMKP